MKTQRNILVTLLILLGLGALFGGGVLIISPSGNLLGMPLSMLESSPFANFLIPGIILFSVLGLAPLLTSLALVRKPQNKITEMFNFYPDMYWAWSFSIYIAFSLIIWIQFEMVFLKSVHWSHTLYMFWAISILLFALLPNVRKEYRNLAR